MWISESPFKAKHSVLVAAVMAKQIRQIRLYQDILYPKHMNVYHMTLLQSLGVMALVKEGYL